MIRPINTSEFLLAIPAREAGAQDVVIADDLRDTLYAHKDGCVGMAANMIGQNVAIIVFYKGNKIEEMFNPKIISAKGSYTCEEGCLSLEGQRTTERYRQIKVSWQDRHMVSHEQSFAGFVAQIIQHEIDHINGILI